MPLWYSPRDRVIQIYSPSRKMVLRDGVWTAVKIKEPPMVRVRKALMFVVLCVASWTVVVVPPLLVGYYLGYW